MSRETGITRRPILFQDEFLVVVNKPADVLSHPNPNAPHPNPLPLQGRGKVARGEPRQGRGKGGTVRSAFEGTYHYGDRRFDTPQGPIWLIHRLDQDASGVLLAARDRKSVLACRTAFDRFEVEKRYLTLLSGRPLPPRGSWQDHLEERKKANYVRSFIVRGKPNAELQYATKKLFPNFKLSLVEIKLITGKTHQIRIQAAFHGHPVTGDRIYGNFSLNKKLRSVIGLKRIFLHASVLSFKHPITGNPLQIEAPLPEELEEVLQRAR